MSLRDVIPTRSLVLALPAAAFVVVMGLGALQPRRLRLGRARDVPRHRRGGSGRGDAVTIRP